MKNIKLSVFFAVVFGACAGMIPQKVSAQEFHFFPKPMTSGTSIFVSQPSTIPYLSSPQSAYTPILLEACERDAFVAAWHPSLSSDVMLSAFDGLNHRSPSSGL